MNFLAFKNAVAAQFKIMQEHKLYTVADMQPIPGSRPDEDGAFPTQDVVKSKMIALYPASFPAGTNEVFRQRPVHECNCCASFIRTVGNVVAIIDGRVVTIWDVIVPGEDTYTLVAAKMGEYIRSLPIDFEFLHSAAHAGVDTNRDNLADITWDHFYAKIDAKFVMAEKDMGPYLSKRRGTLEAYKNSLTKLAPDSVDVVIDLLANGSLYRGDEKEGALLAFKAAVEKYQAYEGDKALYLLNTMDSVHESIAKMRGTSMGKLLRDITKGRDLESSVLSYESIVAPGNYKRSNSVVTQKMKDQAQAFVEARGLEPSLPRRHAKPTDISVVNTLFTNRKARSLMAGSVFDDLAVSQGKKQDFSKVEEVSIAQFISKILPQAETLELMLEAEHVGNLMTLTAPVYDEAEPILKWDNNFAWSYRGGVTDSIKERVKQAGGEVEADLCFRLSWSNTDDLDIHVREPNGFSINFSSRHSSYTDGQLDIDMNSPSAVKTRTPVENIFYKNRAKMKEGAYTVYVNQYQLRERSDTGFQLDMDYMGQIHKFSYDKPLGTGQTVEVAVVNYTHKDGARIVKSLPFTATQQTEWGVTTQTWTSVNMVMLSPNHWDGQEMGNKHWFFILDECKNPEPVRGLYNEFLTQEFWEHRKVFEVLGAKLQAPYTDEQLSGVGFSSTIRNSVLCRVGGAFNRIIKIVF